MVVDGGKPLVLVTGANSGLGFAVVQELAGAHHVLVGARTQEKADDAVARLVADPDYPVAAADLSTVPLELGNDASIAEAARQVQDRFGSLDILINSAGVFTGGPDVDLREDYRFVFETNVFGTGGKNVHDGAKPIIRAAIEGDPKRLTGTLVADESTEYGW